jgi:hypothetical protein
MLVISPCPGDNRRAGTPDIQFPVLNYPSRPTYYIRCSSFWFKTNQMYTNITTYYVPGCTLHPWHESCDVGPRQVLNRAGPRRRYDFQRNLCLPSIRRLRDTRGCRAYHSVCLFPKCFFCISKRLLSPACLVDLAHDGHRMERSSCLIINESHVCPKACADITEHGGSSAQSISQSSPQGSWRRGNCGRA